jgi:hypothetical protein
MRKLVWCGAALMVGGAVAVFLAANHAAKHPNSYLGRCAATAAYLGFRANPFVLATGLVPTVGGEPSNGLVGGVVAGAVGCIHEQLGMAEVGLIRKPVPPAPEVREPAEAAELVEPDEPVEPIRPEVPFDEPELRGDALERFVLPEMPEETEEPMPVVQPEADPFEGFSMPIADPSEEPEAIPAPAVAEPVHEMIAAPTEDISEGEETAEEESSVEHPEAIPAPTSEEGCEKGCCHGCCGNWVHYVLKLFGLTPESAPATEPTCTEETSPQGETAPEQNSPPPQSYHHGCPHMSCPYMGCPYPYSRPTPPVSEPPAPAPKKVKPMPESGWLEALWKKLFAAGLCPAPVSCPVEQPMSEMPRKKPLVVGYGEDEMPRPTGIDTMEFRPTDDPRDPPGTHPF